MTGFAIMQAKSHDALCPQRRAPIRTPSPKDVDLPNRFPIVNQFVANSLGWQLTVSENGFIGRSANLR
jgi:hypothetical protein